MRLLGPVAAVAAGTCGVSRATGSVHGACKASQGGRHGPDDRLGLEDPTRAQFNHALGPLDYK